MNLVSNISKPILQICSANSFTTAISEENDIINMKEASACRNISATLDICSGIMTAVLVMTILIGNCTLLYNNTCTILTIELFATHCPPPNMSRLHALCIINISSINRSNVLCTLHHRRYYICKKFTSRESVEVPIKTHSVICQMVSKCISSVLYAADSIERIEDINWVDRCSDRIRLYL